MYQYGNINGTGIQTFIIILFFESIIKLKNLKL